MRRIVDQDLPVLHVGDLACEFHFQVAGYRREVAEISIPLPVVGHSLCRRLLRVRVRHILWRGIRRRGTALRKGFRRVGRSGVRSFACLSWGGLSTSLGWRGEQNAPPQMSVLIWVLYGSSLGVDNGCRLRWTTGVVAHGPRVSFLVDSACLAASVIGTRFLWITGGLDSSASAHSGARSYTDG